VQSKAPSEFLGHTYVAGPGHAVVDLAKNENVCTADGLDSEPFVQRTSTFHVPDGNADMVQRWSVRGSKIPGSNQGKFFCICGLRRTPLREAKNLSEPRWPKDRSFGCRARTDFKLDHHGPAGRPGLHAAAAVAPVASTVGATASELFTISVPFAVPDIVGGTWSHEFCLAGKIDDVPDASRLRDKS